MKPIEAFIYGSIQGLSEFLPVSSSGHLALLPHVMKINDPGVVFDLMMHLGTALAVIAYFFKDLKNYTLTLTPKLLNLKSGSGHEWFVRNFIFSTLISVLCIVILLPVSKLARNPHVIMVNLTVFGILLGVSDWLHKRNGPHLESPFESKMQWRLAILIGMAQALAIFPGVSRSGITLTAALLLGLRRKDAGHFSFLLSLPIILAGILKEIPDLLKSSGGEEFLPLLIGVGTSFVVGYLTIHYFLKLLSRIELYLFSVYRIFIALLMLFVL